MDKVFGPLKQGMTRAARALGYMRRELVLSAQKFPPMLAQGIRSISKEQVIGTFKLLAHGLQSSTILIHKYYV